jgi:AcrR family transcriptional regulator
MGNATAGHDRDPASLRADAERNRARIIEAARRMFGDHGLTVPMADIARCAGVGVGTLYRRFPNRDDLVAATFAAKMTAYADAVDRARADPDPWRGLTGYLYTICRMQADDHGFTDVLTMTFPTVPAFEAERDRAYHGLVDLIERAKATGRLRDDFTPEDVVILLMANAGVINATAAAAPTAWRRLTALMIQSYRADGAVPAPPAPAPRAMYRALVRVRPGPPETTP